MVSWQIGRRPIRQAGPVLLVVVATATTTLALAGWRSWQQSAADQAAFAVGSDVRVGATAGIPLDPRAIIGEAVIVLRCYPSAARALARIAGRSRGVAAFVGLARATRTPPGAALPAFALVLVLTMVAFPP